MMHDWRGCGNPWRDPGEPPQVVSEAPPSRRWVSVAPDGSETDFAQDQRPDEPAAIRVQAKTYPNRVVETTLARKDAPPPGHGWRHVRKTFWRRVREREQIVDADTLAAIEIDMLCARVRPRDGQRSKVYKADAALKPFAVPLKSVADVERFVREVWASKRVQAAFPKAVRLWVQPYVKDGRGTRRPRGCASYIGIPRWARTSDVVLHELAHVVTIREHLDQADVAGHGWQYCSVFLKLVLYVIGREAHDALKVAMKTNRVRYRQPRKRQPLSPERRAQLIEVLARAREKREVIRRRRNKETPR